MRRNTARKVAFSVNGEKSAEVSLPDDPADHRGILSWSARNPDGHGAAAIAAKDGFSTRLDHMVIW
jgi:hypothetical protein